MKTLRAIGSAIWNNRTKLLGYAQVALASLSVADPALINGALGPNGMRWILLTSGLLTAIVGHYNSQKGRAQEVAKPVEGGV